MFLSVSDCKRISSAPHPKFQSNLIFRQKNGLIEWVTYAFLPNTEEFASKPTQSTAIFGQIALRALPLSVTHSGNPKSQRRGVSVEVPEAKIGE
jgi:hypothetical protein